MSMLKKNLVQAVVATLGIVLFFQVGCAGRSKTSSFYVLSPMAGSEAGMEKVFNGNSDIAIGISPVALPKYLKKSQIVTRTGRNELHLAEYDRWAGKIDEDIGRVIAENLSHMLSTDKVLSYPAMEAIAIDYNINIDISRFDGRLGGTIELIVRWGIFDKQGNAVYGLKATHIIEPTKGSGYADMVGAQSRALGVFSRELADAIKKMAGG